MCDKYSWQMAKYIHNRHTRLLVREDITRAARLQLRKICVPESQGSWSQGDLIGGKPSVVK
jgi:hypothetical protein